MLKVAALTVALAALFTEYPAFVQRDVLVEAYTDRGPIVEMIVRCPAGTGIISYSKLEKLYCSSKNACFGRLHAAVDDTCH